MPDQTLKQLRTAGKFISEANLKAIALAYLESDPDGTPDSIAANLGVLMRQMYKIAPSVASNNLTLAVQHLDGTTPSATNPLAFKIGNSWKIVTSALTVTKNAGTNWCNAGSAELAANATDFFVYVINETGASAGTKVGFSRISHGRTMANFVNVTTSEKYIAGSWTNFNSTDEVEVVGRFRAQLSAAAAYNWSIAASVVINRPIFESDWVTWQPVYSALAPMTWTAVTTSLAKYKISSNGISFEINASGTSGGTASSQLIFTVPFINPTASSLAVAATLFNNAGVTEFGGGLLNGSSSNVLNLRYNAGNFTLGVAGVVSNGFFDIS